MGIKERSRVTHPSMQPLVRQVPAVTIHPESFEEAVEKRPRLW